jgi:class III poly(R)-hydroxyalkanoic acid synthase PhaE subunit
VNTSSSKPNFVDAWLETQQGWLKQWQATALEQRVDSMRVGMETWRKQFDPANPSGEMLNVVQGFQTLLQSCVAQTTAQATPNQSSAQTNPFVQLMQSTPIGFSRERQLEWQAYLKAYGNYQQCATQLIQQFVNVFTLSLQRVQAKVEEKTRAGQPMQSMRELYDLWIECGEQCFAEIAKDDAFVRIQAAHTNALSILKLSEHALLERWLQERDLPTRSEVNSLHQTIRAMNERIAELEARLSTFDASAKQK